jgi:hypothetical protein
MRQKLHILAASLVIPLVIGIVFASTWNAAARPQQGGVLDVTVKSCADFSATESHLDAASYNVTTGYKSIPGQIEPVREIKHVENPEKVQEFMAWYANGGSTEMSMTGSSCTAEMYMKSGEEASV